MKKVLAMVLTLCLLGGLSMSVASAEEVVTLRWVTVGNGMGFLGDFVTNGSLRQWRRPEVRLRSVRSKFDFLLASFNDFVYFRVPLKSFPWLVCAKTFSAKWC